MLDGQPFSWLPVGRSLFRDKRIPRENLNGLVVEKTGMATVLYTLTGIGGPWAQDPPYYAEVVAFETGKEMDWAHIRLTGWLGWHRTSGFTSPTTAGRLWWWMRPRGRQ